MASFKLCLISLLCLCCHVTHGYLRGINSSSDLSSYGSWYADASAMGKSPGLSSVMGNSIFAVELNSASGYSINLSSGEIFITQPGVQNVSSGPLGESGSWVLFQTEGGASSSLGYVDSTSNINEYYSLPEEDFFSISYLSTQSCLVSGASSVFHVNNGSQTTSKWVVNGGELNLAAPRAQGGFIALFGSGEVTPFGSFDSFANIPTFYFVSGVTFFDLVNLNGEVVLVGQKPYDSAWTQIYLGTPDFDTQTMDTVSVYSAYGSDIRTRVCNNGLYIYDGGQIFHYNENLQLVNSFMMQFGSQTEINSLSFQCSPDNSRLVFGLQVTVDSVLHNQLLVLDADDLSNVSSSLTGLTIKSAGPAPGKPQTLTMEYTDTITIDVSQVSLETSNQFAEISYTQIGSLSTIDLEQNVATGNVDMAQIGF